jgi:hypothetical protein
LLNQSGFIKANKKLKSTGELVPVHRAKAGAADNSSNTLLSGLFVSATRSTEELFIVQSPEHHLSNIITALKSALPKDISSRQDVAPAPAPDSDWEKEFESLLKSNKKEQARGVWLEKLNKTEAEFQARWDATQATPNTTTTHPKTAIAEPAPTQSPIKKTWQRIKPSQTSKASKATICQC